MGLTDREKEIILALAESDMSVSQVSRVVYYHRNTLEYHFVKIKRKTGLNPKRFYDLVKLVDMAKS